MEAKGQSSQSETDSKHKGVDTSSTRNEMLREMYLEGEFPSKMTIGKKYRQTLNYKDVCTVCAFVAGISVVIYFLYWGIYIHFEG